MRVIGYPQASEREVGGVTFRRLITVELTRRNLTVLLRKLDDPRSVRTILKDGVAVRAVEDEEHYADREPGPMLVNGRIT